MTKGRTYKLTTNLAFDSGWTCFIPKLNPLTLQEFTDNSEEYIFQNLYLQPGKNKQPAIFKKNDIQSKETGVNVTLEDIEIDNDLEELRYVLKADDLYLYIKRDCPPQGKGYRKNGILTWSTSKKHIAVHYSDFILFAGGKLTYLLNITGSKISGLAYIAMRFIPTNLVDVHDKTVYTNLEKVPARDGIPRILVDAEDTLDIQRITHGKISVI